MKNTIAIIVSIILWWFIVADLGFIPRWDKTIEEIEAMRERLRQQNVNVIERRKQRELKEQHFVEVKRTHHWTVSVNNSFAEAVAHYWIQEPYAEAMTEVSTRRAMQEFGLTVNPKYLLVIGITENMRNWWAVGDGWCSFGAYQMNECSSPVRRDGIWYWMSWRECALDPWCSSKWTLDRIVHVYQCDIQPDGSISNPDCLARHQWFPFNNWYLRKIRNNLADVNGRVM